MNDYFLDNNENDKSYNPNNENHAAVKLLYEAFDFEEF